MKRLLKGYTEFLPIIILVVYALGYGYQFGFYRYFGIRIEYYINLTDIVFSTINNLFFALIYFIIIHIVVFISTEGLMKFYHRIKMSKRLKLKNTKTIKRYESFISKKWEFNYTFNSFLTFILLFGIFGFIFKEISLFILTIFTPYALYRIFRVVMSIPSNKSEEKFRQEFYYGIYSLTIIALLFSFIYWGYRDAEKIKINYSNVVLKTDNINTEDGIHKFIGETSNYYFILNSENDNVIILNKSSLDKIEVLENKFKKAEKEEMDYKFKQFLNDFKSKNK